MFLEILTRHLATRAGLLARCRASLDGQTDADWVQTVLIDDVGRGVPWANANLGRYAPHLEGDYIWVLDDDDVCMCDTLVADVKQVVRETDADVVMVKGEINRFGVLPDHWGETPTYCHVAMPNFILRRAVWQKHAPMLSETVGETGLGADYRLIRDVFDAGTYRIAWLDRVVMRSETARFGAAA